MLKFKILEIEQEIVEVNIWANDADEAIEFYADGGGTVVDSYKLVKEVDGPYQLD